MVDHMFCRGSSNPQVRFIPMTKIAPVDTIVRPMGRKKLYHSRITFPLSSDILAAIDARRGHIKRVEWLRMAIEKELRRPPKAASRKGRGK
jgi:hypothetical protein